MKTKHFDYILLGKKLKEQRNKLKLTQSNVAEKVDVSINYIGQIERGEKIPSIETLIKLSNSLNISTDSLLAENLENDIKDEKAIYLTDKQIKVISKIITLIKDNF